MRAATTHCVGTSGVSLVQRFRKGTHGWKEEMLRQMGLFVSNRPEGVSMSVWRARASAILPACVHRSTHTLLEA